MKSLREFRLIVIFLPAFLTACTFEEGNPDLSGSWTCTETSEIYMKSLKGQSVYQVTLTRDLVNQNKYYVENFYKLGTEIKVAILKEGNTITIPKQTVNGFLFEGTGAVNETFDLINLQYTADDGGGEVDHVTAEYAR